MEHEEEVQMDEGGRGEGVKEEQVKERIDKGGKGVRKRR